MAGIADDSDQDRGGREPTPLPTDFAAAPSLTARSVGTSVEAQAEALGALDLHELRVRWRKLFRSTAPEHLPKFLLLRIIAYKLQANAYGDLDRETQRYLNEIE